MPQSKPRKPATSTDDVQDLNLENSKIVIQIVDHTVIGVSVAEGLDHVNVSGNSSSLPPGSSFSLYDDDDYGLNRDPLPRTDLIDDVIKNVYRPAFVEVIDAAKHNPVKDYNPEKYIDFRVNHPATVGVLNPMHLVWEDEKDLSDTHNRWVGNLVTGYQNEHGVDADPKVEQGSDGHTPEFTRRYSIVHVKIVRDSTSDSGFRNSPHRNKALNDDVVRNLKPTAAHESGHMPGGGWGGHHAELQVMGDGGAANNVQGEVFSAKTPSRFRRTQEWQKPFN